MTAGATRQVERFRASGQQIQTICHGNQERIGRSDQTLNELPHPQVDFTFGFSNLKPAPSRVST